MQIRLRDGTGTMSLKYLSEEPDRHGNMRLYVRRRGRRIRMRAPIGTEAFLAEYKAALEGAAKPVGAAPDAGTFKWLKLAYLASAEFKRLDPATQTVRRRILEAIPAKHDANRVKAMRPKHVRFIRDEKSETPHAADNLLKALRTMFKWAVKYEHMDANPAREVEKIGGASDGHHTWTIEEIIQYLKRHPVDTKAGLALVLLLGFGVRRSDVVKLGRQMESADGEWLRIVETKGKKRIVKAHDLPILPWVRAVLTIHRTSRLSYLATEYGRPFTANGFGGWFRDRCDEAGLEHCSAHGLRKAGATIAGDNGATELQLMALYGWENPAEAARYTRRANRKKLAGAAANLLLLGDHKMNIAVAPVRAGETNS